MTNIVLARHRSTVTARLDRAISRGAGLMVMARSSRAMTEEERSAAAVAA
jgi:hypothetical protein